MADLLNQDNVSNNIQTPQPTLPPIPPQPQPTLPPIPPQPQPQLPPIQTPQPTLSPVPPQPQPTLPPVPPQPQPQPQLPPIQTPQPTLSPVPPQPNIDVKESITTDGKFDINKFKQILQTYLVDKCPIALPDSIKEFCVKFIPILSLIGVIVSLPLIVAYFGVSLVTLPFASVSSHGFMYYVDMIKIFGSFIFEIIVIPGLFKRKIKAWNLLFYFAVFNLIFSILTLNIGNILVGTIISFYFLFQCRSKYIN